MFQVSFIPNRSNSGERIAQSFDNAADAIDAFEAHRAIREWPRIEGNGFSAFLCEDRFTGKREWGFSFANNDGYKNSATYRAEASGVRYASHRKGYRSSARAFAKFMASMEEFAIKYATAA